MPRLPAVAVRQYRRTSLSVLALAASLLAATSCADAPTASTAEPRPSNVPRAAVTAARPYVTAGGIVLDSNVYLPYSGTPDPYGGWNCASADSLPLLTDVQGEDACAVLIDARTDRIPRGDALRVQVGDSLILRCAVVSYEHYDGRIAPRSRIRWDYGWEEVLTTHPNSADGGETAVVRAIAPGTMSAKCVHEGGPPGYGWYQVGTTMIEVVGEPRQLAAIELAPDTVRLELGQWGPALVRMIDQYGHDGWIDPAIARWEVVRGSSVGSLGANGAFQATTVGRADVRKVWDGPASTIASNTITIDVKRGYVARVETAGCCSQTILVGDAPIQISARPLNRFGFYLADVPVRWSVGDTSIATVSPTGVLTVKQFGSTQVNASAEGATTSMALFVNVPRVTTVTVTPYQPPAVSPNAQLQLTASAYDQRQRLMSGIAFTWQSTNQAVAVVSPTGLVTAKTAGTATITANANGVTGYTTLTVAAPPPPPPTTTPVCGDALGCLPVQAAYVSHFQNADCTGTEYYYTAYFGYDGKRRSWNGTGIAGKSAARLTVKSYKLSDGGGDGTGCRRNVWGTAGYTFDGMSRIYR